MINAKILDSYSESPPSGVGGAMFGVRCSAGLKTSRERLLAIISFAVGCTTRGIRDALQ